MKRTHQKRRKNPRRTGRQRGKRAAQALAAGAAIAGGTQAYADPIRFDNPAHGEAGHFHWGVPRGTNDNWLDFTREASAQPGVTDGPTSLRHTFTATFANVARVNAPIDLQVDPPLLEGVSGGTLIPSGFGWGSYGYTFYPGYGSRLPSGIPTYLGFRFDTGSGDQYGWLGVVMTGVEVDAFAWGYETDPGVPIAAGIPEPGTLAMLAFGAAAAAVSRRQRRGQQLD
jgi:hypothetical protein